jgi:hypothetical protein
VTNVLFCDGRNDAGRSAHPELEGGVAGGSVGCVHDMEMNEG